MLARLVDKQTQCKNDSVWLDKWIDEERDEWTETSAQNMQKNEKMKCWTWEEMPKETEVNEWIDRCISYIDE
jgi:hypothetical protein